MKNRIESNQLRAAFQTSDDGSLCITLFSVSFRRYRSQMKNHPVFRVGPVFAWFWLNCGICHLRYGFEGCWCLFWIFIFKSQHGHAGKSKSLRNKNLGYISLIGILIVFSWISLTACCSHMVLVGHSEASISVIISLCFVCWAVISHSEEALWSNGISTALVRWKTDGFLSGQRCF